MFRLWLAGKGLLIRMAGGWLGRILVFLNVFNDVQQYIESFFDSTEHLIAPRTEDAARLASLVIVVKMKPSVRPRNWPLLLSAYLASAILAV